MAEVRPKAQMDAKGRVKGRAAAKIRTHKELVVLSKGCLSLTEELCSLP